MSMPQSKHLYNSFVMEDYYLMIYTFYCDVIHSRKIRFGECLLTFIQRMPQLRTGHCNSFHKNKRNLSYGSSTAFKL